MGGQMNQMNQMNAMNLGQCVQPKETIGTSYMEEFKNISYPDEINCNSSQNNNAHPNHAHAHPLQE